MDKRNKNNKNIGDLGEYRVIKYEKQKLTELGKNTLIDKVEHIAKSKGDGAGYDIKSFDRNGNEIFIEVKTTSSSCSTPFFITRTELERSQQEKENYRLYRLYNYNKQKDSCEIAIYKGDLTELCNYSIPASYKIRVDDKK